ncbi:MAG: NTP transferase domain-containing protein, partial [Candidatus Altiarchaeota archaeon]|nr:NTP transferase domain-containing protein [Candidatus Altiarchaeota archaeon]
MEVKSALVLAAGEGTRMHPLTLTKPKPLLPVGGKPLIQWTIDALKKSKIKDIFLLVGRDENTIRNVFGDEVSYIKQEKPEGTAHAIGMADGVIKDPFVCINGDVVVEETLFPELAKYYEEKKVNIITVTESQNPADYGVVEVDKDMRVTKLLEKPKLPSSNLINAGVYVFTPDIFSLVKKTKKSQRGEYEITDTLILSEAFAHRYMGFWMDIGKPWDLLLANEFFVRENKGVNKGKVEDFTVVKGNVSVGEGTEIRSGAYIEGPCQIGKDCRIGPNCYIRAFTTLGDNVHIGNGVEIK